jgi:hypothetical protein
MNPLPETEEEAARLEQQAAAAALRERVQQQIEAPFCTVPLRPARWRVRKRLGKVLGIDAK